MSDPIVDFSRSPHARLRPVPLSAVQLTDTFWEPRRTINREVTIPAQLRQCEETGRIDNFRRASGKIQGKFQGIFFNDSDVYKWAEAAAFSLATHPDPKLESDLDNVIAEIAAAQQPDGYLNTYFMFEREKDRYTNLKDMHEIYCGGHLLQAAVAHHRATGKTSLLDVATRLADHWFALFGPGKRAGACGHEEAEMALVELYRDTGNVDYLTLAKRMIDVRGQGEKGLFGKSAYHQDHAPFVEQTEMIGHAVRHLYLCCGAADVLAETGDADYADALETLYRNFTERKMYVTGGAGSRWEGEAFGEDYELPNDRAYTETCAAIGSVMWNWRMLHITGNSRYADLMEHTLYNAVLPGLSLDGTRYFYQNPLSNNGKHRRQKWFGCACCPPNVARMLASLPGYIYSITEKGVYVHLYAASFAAIPMPDGGTVTVTQEADTPWHGEINITVQNDGKAEFISLRIPEWASRAELTIDGEPYEDDDALQIAGYAQVPLIGGATTRISLVFSMPTRLLRSHPDVENNHGRVALQRGPLIYCLEACDNFGFDIRRIVSLDDKFVEETDEQLLGGIIRLHTEARVHEAEDRMQTLYISCVSGTSESGNSKTVLMSAVPYYTWANREPGAMRVWLPHV